MPVSLITVAVFDSQPAAALARSLLEFHGIECHLADEHTVRMAAPLAPVVGGIKLRVAESDLALAREILTPEKPEPVGSPEARALVEREAPQCPECLSRDVVPDSRINLVVAFLSWALSSHPFFRHRRWCCRSCGNDWRPE